ncbi:MAG: response regulator [Candidatus Aminicenantes bacterium]|nr:response regulator [Candidatus Aminicenantes bacterium]
MNKLKILVIEDEKDHLEDICFVLEQAGYKTIKSENGEKGLEMAKNQKPDIIICDLNMPPGLTGYQVLEEIRKDPGTALIPFIILTVFPRQDDVDIEFRLKVQDYIVKPFNFNDLLARVQRCLEEKK